MTLQELIKQLNDFEKQYGGNIECRLATYDLGDEYGFYPVKSVSYAKDTYSPLEFIAIGYDEDCDRDDFTR
jgi:hypothetical protein